MHLDAASSIFIARPRAVVADFLFDARNNRLWASGVIESRPDRPGRLRAGMRVEQISRFLGQDIRCAYEITSAEDERFFELKIDEPLSMWVLYALEDAPGGTIVRSRAKSEGTGTSLLLSPMLSFMTKLNLWKDLRKLRKVLEGGGGPTIH